MKSFFFALRNVIRNRRRSLMAGGVIALGTIAIVSTLGFMLATFYGLGESSIHADVGHIQIAARGGFVARSDPRIGLDQAQQDRIAGRLRGIEAVRFSTRRILFDGLLAVGEQTVAVVGQGVEPLGEQKLSSLFAPMTGGSPLASRGERFEALLGNRLARKIGWKPEDVVSLVGSTKSGSINAVDVIAEGAYTTGIPEKDERAVLVPLNVAQALLDTQKVSRIVVVLRETSATDDVLAALQADFPDLDIKGWRELDPFYDQVVTLYRNIFSILICVLIAVVLLSIGNAMMMAIFERFREIGALRAMGFSRREVLATYSLEGAVIASLGALVGLAAAAGLSLAINSSAIMMPPAPGRTSPYPLIIFIDCEVYLWVAVSMVACGLVGALLPARKAARMPVVEALGHV
jgi:putative ABC transport system permease protein